jgi:hypothetical protein
MADVESILVDNLIETLRQLQRNMTYALSASIAILVLAIAFPGQLTDDIFVEVPSQPILVPIPLSFAVALLVAAYWVSGALATFSVSRATRVISALEEADELLRAVLTYPSIPTTRVHGPRIGLAVLPAVLTSIGLLSFGVKPTTFLSALGFLVLIAPNLILAFELRTAVGDLTPDFYGD